MKDRIVFPSWPGESFSRREMEILNLIVEGLSNEAIAETVFLSLGTIKWYNKRIFKKLGVNSRTQAIVKAQDLGMLDCANPAPAHKAPSTASQPGLPPLAAVLGKTHNLPAELTSLVGRESNLAEIAGLLRLPTTRLLTLTGSGGCGKTRLALRSGVNLARRFPHGAWLVELAPFSDPVLVTQIIIFTLALLVDPNRKPLDTLVSFLKKRSILLILDNCEHLIDEVARLVTTLLRACPELRILTTSREPLGVPGEVTYHVPSLRVPPPDWDGNTQESTAVQLFLERAASAQPGYTLEKGEAPSLARICRRLDGIPLAIELAAARVNVLPLAQIADRLEEDFRVLGTGSRGSIPRHSTLRATVGWSYNLLSASERVLLRRLPLFAGGWLLEQAEEVAAFMSGSDGLRKEDILDLLASLVNKSLVSTERLPAGSADGSVIRYQLHEMVRQYARERLVEAGEEAILRQRFLDCFLRLAEQAEPELKCSRQKEWLDRLDQEQDNFNEALRLATTHQDAVTALRLSGALVPYWFQRDRDLHGLSWLRTSLAMPAVPGDHRSARAKVLAGILFNCIFSALPVDPELHTECERIYLDLNDQPGLAFTRSLAYHQAVPPELFAQLYDCLPELLAGGEYWIAGYVLFRLGEWERVHGNFGKARSCFEESVTMMYRAGDRKSLAIIMMQKTWLDWCEGNIHKACELTWEAIHTFQDDYPWIKAISLKNLTIFCAALGDFTAAHDYINKAIQVFQAAGAFWVVPSARQHISRLFFLEGRLVEARVEIENSMDQPEEVRSTWGNGVNQLYLGQVLWKQNQLDRAAELLSESLLVNHQETPDSTMRAALCALGLVRLAQGDLIAARDLLQRAIATKNLDHTLPDLPEILDCLASLAIAEGNSEQAARLLGASDSLLARMEMVRYKIYQTDYERCREAGCQSLGEDRFFTAYSAGLELATSTSFVESVANSFI